MRRDALPLLLGSGGDEGVGRLFCCVSEASSTDSSKDDAGPDLGGTSGERELPLGRPGEECERRRVG